MKFLLILSTLLLAGWTMARQPHSVDSLVDRDSYEGFKVFSVVLTSGQRSLLENLKSLVPVDTWKDVHLITPKHSKMIPMYKSDFMVSLENSQFVSQYLQSHSIQHEIVIPNVQSLIDTRKEASRLHQAERQAKGLKAIDWEDYYRLAEVYEWLDDIANQNDDISSVSTIGQSTEGRDIKMIKISQPGSPANKSSILIDGTFHAREWISPAIVTWMINDLLTNRDANVDVLNRFDFYIIPFINPDGYEYAHTSSRMWRKTRSQHDDSSCFGVDPNRNSDFHFGGGGTSGDHCSDIYRGPSAFSEPETAAFRDVVNSNLGNWHAYFTVHCCGLMWLTPWSWTYDHPPDTVELVEFGRVGAAAISSIHGTEFDVGESSEVYGITAGSSDDWAHGVANIKFSQTIEVDDGANGFETPTEEIIPIAIETWEGIKASSLSA
jgi:carboxypeptidase A2